MTPSKALFATGLILLAGCTHPAATPSDLVALRSVTITSSDARPTRLSTLSCAITGATDSESRSLTTSWEWKVNGSTVSGSSSATLAGAFTEGQTVSCSATVSDGAESATASSPTLLILPVLPTVASVSVVGQLSCGTWTCQASGVADADGDTVVLQYQWWVAGALLASDTGETLPAGRVSGGVAVACAAQATVENGSVVGPAVTSAPVTGVDPLPAIASVTLPSSAHPGAVLTCAVAATDACTLDPTISVTWSVNGTAVPDSASETFSTAQVDPGDTVSCTATVSDGMVSTSATSNATAMTNHPPQITTVTITSSTQPPTVLSTLTCNVSASDLDSDRLTTAYAWQVNGSAVSGATAATLFGAFAAGQSVTCTATVADPWASVSATSSPLQIGAALPTIASVSVSGQDACGTWTCNASGVEDVDGTPVAVIYSWTVNDMTVGGATGPTLPAGNVSGGQQVACTAQGSAGSILGPVITSSPVTSVDDTPVIASVSLAASVSAGALLTCAVSASDECTNTPPLSVTWQVNGTTVQGATGITFSTSQLISGTAVSCTAAATNGMSSATATSNTATIVQPPQIAAATLTSSLAVPTLLTTLTCAASGVADPDSATLTTTYAWRVNGTAVASATANTLAGAFSVGQSVTCAVTISDSDGTASAISSPVVIVPALPTVGSVAVTGVGDCTPYSCVASDVQDADGDPVTLQYQWLVNGVDQQIQASTLPVGWVQPGDSVQCGASGTVGAVQNGVTVYGPESLSPAITGADNPPVVTVELTPPGPRVGDVLSCSATVSDVCTSSPSLTLGWVVNGNPGTKQPSASGLSASTTLSTASNNPGDAVLCSASVGGISTPTTVDSNVVTLAATTWTITANIAGGSAGYSVAVIDDLTGAGFREIAIGAPNTDPPNANSAGAVYIVNGGNTAATTSLAPVIAGTGGAYQAGEHGNFALATMACEPDVTYSQTCPSINNVGNIMADISGPNGAALGFGLAYAGDIDGDGIGDLVAAAPYDQVGDIWLGQTFVMSGKALYGRPFDEAVNGQAGFVFQGECGRRPALDVVPNLQYSAANGDLAGWSVVPIGDSNGDGLGDFAVSAPNNGDFDEGTVYAIFGRTDGLTVQGTDIFQRGCDMEGLQVPGPASGTAGFAAYSANVPQANTQPARWGTLLAPLGDFNGDGYDDFLIQASDTTPSDDDWIMLGGRTPTPQVITTVSPATQYEVELGTFSIVCNNNGCTSSGLYAWSWPHGGGGDVNGDGYDDLAMDAIDYSNGGILNVLYGRNEPTGILSIYNTTDGSGRGFEVAGGGSGVNFTSASGATRIVGDLNGDGYDDIVMGLPTQGTSNQGAVLVIFGSPTPPVGLSLTSLRAGIGGFTIEPSLAGAQFGYSIASGDVDGDGLVDLVIGAPFAPGTDGESNAGNVQVVFGRDFNHDVITFQGGPGDDTFTGTPAAESFVGGEGNDTLIGGGGADVIYGGAGNDTIEVDDDSFFRVNGGEGTDTLVLGQNVTGLTLTGAQRRRIQDIERFQLEGQTVTLSNLGLVDISSTNHTYAFFGSGAVIVNPNDLWVSAGTLTGSDGNLYRTYTDGVTQLWVASTLGISIPPTVFIGNIGVNELTPVGTTVATLRASDPNGNSATLTWSLVSDQSGAFTVDSSGHLIVTNATPLNFATFVSPWNLTVTVTDQAGLQTQATFTTSVLEIPLAPVFESPSPVWTVPENAQGLLGNVQAVDPNDGSASTYVLVTNPSSMFQIDSTTGDISLVTGAGFNIGTASTYAVTVSATDDQNLSSATTVTINVYAVNPLTQSAQIEFDLRNWSIYQDSTSTSFSGTQIAAFTPGQVSSTCVGPPSGGGAYAQPWSANVLDGPGLSSLPVQFDAQYNGELCTSASFDYSAGSVNATIPYNVTFSYPGTLAPGQTFTFNSTATPVTSNAALWGTTSGLAFGLGVQFQDFGMYLAFCNNLTNSCSTILDKQDINGTYEGSWGFPPQSWTGSLESGAPDAGTADAGSSDAGAQLVLALQTPVSSTSNGTEINWDDYIFSALSALNLPSNMGTYKAMVGGTEMELDYTLINTQVGMTANANWTFELVVNGINATLTYEDGTTAIFPLGTPAQLTIPQDADLNGDGRVEISIALSLNATFIDNWNHTEETGYIYTAGYGRMEAFNDVGSVIAENQAGPALVEDCIPSGSEQAVNPLGCVGTSESETYTFRPSGFSQPVIQGGFDLAPDGGTASPPDAG